MALPQWVIDRLRLRSLEPESAGLDPARIASDPIEAEVIEPDGYYTTVRCPDPDCGALVKVPAPETVDDRYVLPGHYVDRYIAPGVDRRCWIGGIRITDARSIIAIREENGGRLKRAAHP